MPLTPGARLGSYEVVALLGEGGMGQVYRARDTKLDRDVAIKVLPDAFVADPDRVARFQREAKTLASLNHPNIGGIHGLEEADGVKALVLELIDGPTLADRIAQGPLPIDEALPIAKQIAEALEAAHEQGVIHRDLKPANIKLRPDGAVKVLDFGLAKAIDSGPGAGSSASMSPTITTPAMTLAGVILGTAAYMSPEQAKGRAADKRSDVWAFGCVLYEMLTGKRAFDGEDVSDTLAVVLRGSPDWEALPEATPPSIVKLIKNCLQRDRKERVPDIAVARLEIRDALAAPATTPALAPAQQLAPAPKPLSRRAASLVVTALLTAAIAGAAAWLLKPVPPIARPVTRFTVPLPDGHTFTNNNSQSLSLSSDGTRLVYVANTQLFARSMTDLQPRPIPGTSEAPSPINPVFSPDGQWIAYYSQQSRQIKRIAWSGGAAVPICAAPPAVQGMRWDGEDILFGLPKGIVRVSANGGEPEVVVSAKEGETLYGAQRLPGDEWILVTVATATNPGSIDWDKASIVGHSLKSSERRTLIPAGSDGRYLPTGHIVYALGGVLFAVAFDPGGLTVTGGPVPVVEGVKRSLTGATGAAHVSVSDTGSLAFIPGRVSISGGDFDLGIVDRSGTVQPLKLPPGPYEFPRLSPDGNQVAFGSDDGRDAFIMVYNLSTQQSRRLTVGGRNRIPVWSDDTYVLFQSDREGDLAIFRQRADGSVSAERVTKPDKDTEHLPESVSPNGKTLLFSVKKGGAYQLGAWSMTDKVLTAPFAGVESLTPVSATFHPDGKWIVYTTTPTLGVAASTLFVQPFPPNGSIYPITKTNAIHPIWSPTGKELSYGPAPGQYSALSFSTTPSPNWGNPMSVPKILLERGPGAERNHDVMPDGQRFLGVIQTASAGTAMNTQIQVVLNWFEELKARVPQGSKK